MKAMKFLTKAEIAAACPAALESGQANHLSEKYVHVSTITLIDDMDKLGWKVSEAKQVRSKKKDEQFRKHMVTFRNEEITITSQDGETVYPQILVTNSHDGSSSFQFRAGLFRLVCTNGLVVATEDFGKEAIRHKGYSFEEVKSKVMEMVQQLPLTVETLNRFREVDLNYEQQMEFALKAIGIRFGENGASIEPEAVLEPRRSEDRGSDLWVVFNRVQENLTQGGFKYQAASGRNKTARRIKNYMRDLELNQQLYALAEEFANG